MTEHEEMRAMMKRRTIQDADYVIADCDRRLKGERPRLFGSILFVAVDTIVVVATWLAFAIGWIFYVLRGEDDFLRLFLSAVAALVFWLAIGAKIKPDYEGISQRRANMRSAKAMREMAVRSRSVAAAQLASMEKSSRGL